jgi:hypothetical protein
MDWFAMTAGNQAPFCFILREPNLGTKRLSFRKPAGRESGVMWERHADGRGSAKRKAQRAKPDMSVAPCALRLAPVPPCALRFTLCAGLLLAAGSAALVHSQAGASLDVSGYPPEQQQRYKQFAEKCSRCHDLSRPLAARYNEAGWRQLVVRMARKPGAGINRREQQQIAEFLVFYGQQGHGVARPDGSAGTPSTAAPGDTGTGARPGVAAAPISLGQASQAGVRVEVAAWPAQPSVQLTEGKWVQVAPATGDNTYLVVRLYDSESGEKVPYARVKARFRTDAGEGPEKELLPAYGSGGFHYGANFAAPAPLRVQVTIEPPALTRVGDGAARWMNPVTLQFTVQNGP